jgi:AbrB family looped-hinge helix DNA binding protein
MRTSIDSAGRLVVPKALRDAVGLTPGQALEITAHDGRLEIEPVPAPVTLIERDGLLVAAPENGSTDEPSVLRADDVRAVLEQTRR